MFCKNCGKDVANGIKVCDRCGLDIRSANKSNGSLVARTVFCSIGIIISLWIIIPLITALLETDYSIFSCELPDSQIANAISIILIGLFFSIFFVIKMCGYINTYYKNDN